MSKIMMEVYPVEDTQAKLEQIKALVRMITHTYRHDRDDDDFETNMVTLFDMVYDAHAELGKHIDTAYTAHRAQHKAEG